MDGQFVATIARFLILVRAPVYDILRFVWHSPQPHNPAAVHAFDVFIAATRDAVLSWTKANRTRAVVKFVPLGLAVYIFVDVNRNSSTLRTRLSRQRSRVRVPCTRRVPRFGVSAVFIVSVGT